MTRIVPSRDELIAELIWEQSGRNSQIPRIAEVLERIQQVSNKRMSIRQLHTVLFQPATQAGRLRERVPLTVDGKRRDYPAPSSLPRLITLFEEEIYSEILLTLPTNDHEKDFQSSLLISAVLRGMRFFEYGNRITSLLLQAHLLHQAGLQLSRATLLPVENFKSIREEYVQPIWEKDSGA